MAFRGKNNLLVSYSCKDLLQELSADKHEFNLKMVDFAYYMRDGIALPISYKGVNEYWGDGELIVKEKNNSVAEVVTINTDILIEYLAKLDQIISDFDFKEYEAYFKE